MQHLVAVRFRTDDLCRQLSVAEGDMCSGLRFAPRTGKAFPVPAAEIAQQHDLHAAARRPRAEEPRRDHAGIVHHKAVTLVEKVREKTWCSVAPVRLSSVRRREASRRSSGVWAISSGGRS